MVAAVAAATVVVVVVSSSVLDANANDPGALLFLYRPAHYYHQDVGYIYVKINTL
jgi:hypothetical protein